MSDVGFWLKAFSKVIKLNSRVKEYKNELVYSSRKFRGT